MINFNLKPYEWRIQMDIIMENVDLKNIELSNAAVTFDLSNCHDGKPYKRISCDNVWKISINLIEDDFPIFIGDIRMQTLKDANIKQAFEMLHYNFEIPSADNYCLLCIDGGEAEILAICEKIEIVELN